ncbi:MAG: hypothetical protein FP814_05570 [Desulfobacterium sp.]|nr:hypothetical protein [Desulfobacterium sp.]MBU3948697.1 hypothetical protein [Pseudomonadota bacterium]MBU4037088.1 hypothetical protein [Pseudomonadota bacterium]
MIKLGKMENAGPYYGKTLEELEKADLGWSPEEEREIERYCEQIHANCQEEEMTPMERYKATFAGKERDRAMIEVDYFATYAVRILDCFAGALKPLDAYQLPKLLVKSHLATTARFKTDTLFCGPLSYGENLFGCDSKIIDYGNPVHIGDPPIKTVEDLEGLDVPDPDKHAMYPQYLWWLRESRRIFDKYGLSDLIPIEGSHCHGPDGFTAGHLLGYNQMMKALRKNPELVQKTIKLATEWQIKLGIAVTNLGKVDYSYQCGSMGFVPHIEKNLWIADEYREIGNAIKAAIPAENPIVYAWAMEGCVEWLPTVWEKNVAGPGSFDGIMVTGDITSYQKIYDFCQEHDMYGSAAPSDRLMVSGPLSEVEAEVKGRCDCIKKSRTNKCTLSIGAVDYYTSPEHLDFTINAAKKHGKF